MSGSISDNTEARKEAFKKLVPYIVSSLSIFLYVIAFPPFDVGEAAYIFLVPIIGWCFYSPNWKTYRIVSGVLAFVSWCLIISWLRHAGTYLENGGVIAGYFSVCLISLFLGIIYWCWLQYLRWVIPQILQKKAITRIAALLGIAGLWAMLEWLRSYILYGFPWAPLAATQWTNPVILQPSAWMGSYGVSFLLVLINLGIAFYVRHQFIAKTGKWFKRLCPEFYMVLTAVTGTLFVFSRQWPADQPSDHAYNATLVQPNVGQSLKWEPKLAWTNWNQLVNTTDEGVEGDLKPDLIFWPESATPNPVRGDDSMRRYVEAYISEKELPVVMGNMAFEEGPIFYNGVFSASPEAGLAEDFYIKRKLVPFGEFIPWYGRLPVIGNLFATPWDFTAGTAGTVLKIQLKKGISPEGILIPPRTLRVGPLVCYEDIFPYLVRDTVRNGADVIFVATNNGWFGTGGAAYQHASHSVLRAVETRRPVIRCGNAGWSGWIDEYGYIRDVMETPENGVYYKGAKTISVRRYMNFIDTQSFYVQHGDWFIAVCALFFVRSILITLKQPKKKKSSFRLAERLKESES